MNEPVVSSESLPPAMAVSDLSSASATPGTDLAAHFKNLLASDPGSPLSALFQKSIQTHEHHFEGSACIPALHRVAEELRQQGFPRAELSGIDERFTVMRGLALQIFEQIKDIKAYVSDFNPERGKFEVPLLAVVFFGSYVRGKPEPGDLDVRIVIPHAPAHFVDTFMMGFNEAQSAVSWAWRSSSTLPKNVQVGAREVKIALEVDSHYDEGGGLEFVEKCPYLVFVKDEGGGEPRMFMNTSGKGYLAGRAP